ncbi:MAG: hypothetical protein U1E78_05885 [Gammaproteobacteria bacterium]
MKRVPNNKSLQSIINQKNYTLLENWYNIQSIPNAQLRAEKTRQIQNQSNEWVKLSSILSKNDPILKPCDDGSLRNFYPNTSMHLNLSRDFLKILRDQMAVKDLSPFTKIDFAQQIILVHHQCVKENYYSDSILNTLKTIYYQDLKLALETISKTIYNTEQGDYLCRGLCMMEHPEVSNLKNNLVDIYDFFIKYFKEKIVSLDCLIRDDLWYTFSMIQNFAYFFNDLELFKKIEIELCQMHLKELISAEHLSRFTTRHQVAIANQDELEHHVKFKNFSTELNKIIEHHQSEQKSTPKKLNIAVEQTQNLIKIKKEIKTLADIEKNINNISVPDKSLSSLKRPDQ